MGSGNGSEAVYSVVTLCYVMITPTFYSHAHTRTHAHTHTNTHHTHTHTHTHATLPQGHSHFLQLSKSQYWLGQLCPTLGHPAVWGPSGWVWDGLPGTAQVSPPEIRWDAMRGTHVERV